jgi:hypothetical protein
MVRKIIDGFSKNMDSFDVEAYKKRLKIMREILSGDNQTDFAARLGIDFKRWSNYERGYPVPREVAFLLHKQFPGMSIEWIWFGTEQSLSPAYKELIHLAQKLDGEREAQLAEMEKIRQKLNASAEKRKKALHPVGKPKPHQRSLKQA